jgi:FPC/CPF motif-containing protein YcgG
VLRLYTTLASHQATKGLARDVRVFVQPDRQDAGLYCSFVACFSEPKSCSEEEFEHLLWSQLKQLSDADECEWDAAVSTDPSDPDFAFSFAGSAFFVVGLHPSASRPARRFAVPALVFNLHEQFQRLRQRGQYDRMQALIRKRDQVLTGSVNPMLSDFGQRSEARQYSGRVVDDDWMCPFSSDRPERRQ